MRLCSPDMIFSQSFPRSTVVHEKGKKEKPSTLLSLSLSLREEERKRGVFSTKRLAKVIGLGFLTFPPPVIPQSRL